MWLGMALFVGLLSARQWLARPPNGRKTERLNAGLPKWFRRFGGVSDSDYVFINRFGAAFGGGLFTILFGLLATLPNEPLISDSAADTGRLDPSAMLAIVPQLLCAAIVAFCAVAVVQRAHRVYVVRWPLVMWGGAAAVVGAIAVPVEQPITTALTMLGAVILVGVFAFLIGCGRTLKTPEFDTQIDR